MAVVATAGCSPGSSQGTGGGAGGGSAAGGGTGTGGGAATGGGAGTGGGGGAGGGAATGGGTGAGGGAGQGPQLPDGTLLYLRHPTSDRDVLIARDLSTGTERVVTDLTGDGSSGWEIWGYALSPDRRRIVIASLYGPTAADTGTGLATRAIWTLATDGTDFRRLTPTFPNNSGGRQSYSIDVSNPEWSADGSQVVYTYGEYWWENLTLKGGSEPWTVAASGASLPSQFPVAFGCSVLYPSRNPATGEMLLIHSVCVPGIGTNGLYLYPAAGGTSPTALVESSRAAGGIDVSLSKPAWFTDGSGFLFVAASADTNWVPGLFLYDATQHTVRLLVAPEAGTSVDSVAVSRDMTKIVYGIWRNADSSGDLHLIDLSVAMPVDVPLTTDGKSFSPAF